MPHKFLITGLPRSRTAWLAALFSTDNVMCWHEPINKLGTLAAVQSMMDNLKGYSHIGISDSSIGVDAHFYMDYFFDCPIVVIQRPKQEVIESLIRFLGITRKESNKIADTIHEGLKYMVHVRDVMEVDFGELDNTKVVGGIWDYCTRGLPFDTLRCEQFQNLRINQHCEKVILNMNAEPDVNNNNKN